MGAADSGVMVTGLPVGRRFLPSQQQQQQQQRQRQGGGGEGNKVEYFVLEGSVNVASCRNMSVEVTDDGTYEVPAHHKRGRDCLSLLCSDDTYVKRVGLGKEVQPGLRRYVVYYLLCSCNSSGAVGGRYILGTLIRNYPTAVIRSSFSKVQRP